MPAGKLYPRPGESGLRRVRFSVQPVQVRERRAGPESGRPACPGDRHMAHSDINQYMQEINKYPILSPEEEIRQAGKVKAGDHEARNLMITSNLRLVVSIARQYSNVGMTLGDVIAEGTLGLIKAVETFDTGKGCRLSTWATWWIKQAIQRALHSSSKTVRIPTYMIELIGKLKEKQSEFTASRGRKPDIHEIAEELGIPLKNIDNVQKAMNSSCSIEQDLGSELMCSLTDFIHDDSIILPEEALFKKIQSDKIQELLDSISEREAQVLRLRYGLDSENPMTLTDIGKKLNLTKERVRQIERRTLRKLQIIMSRKSED